MARIADVLLSVQPVGRPGGGWSEWNLEGVEAGGSSTLLGPEGSSSSISSSGHHPRELLASSVEGGVGQRGPGGGTARYLRTTQWTRASL
jgi:hypothetical protein